MFNDTVPECPIKLDLSTLYYKTSKKEYQTEVDTMQLALINQLGNCMPNPSTTSIVIPFIIANTETGNVQINIYDQYGKVVKQIPLYKTSLFTEVDISELEVGLYYYSLLINNTIISTKKLVKIE